MASSSPSLSDILKLLRGERDEQKLTGLLLATKFCQGDENSSILKVYSAVGSRFLDRLLMTGSRSLELAMRLLQLILNELAIDMIDAEHMPGLSHMVVALARQFAMLHNALKFDALHLLTILLSSKNSLLHSALKSMSSESWAAYIRLGITVVLQNRVVSREKLQSLFLAESMMSILGEDWHVEQTKMPDNQAQMPVDKYMLLVLETARIEVAVLLNELAYSKYEAPKNSTDEFIVTKQRNLAITFSLIEKIIKLISHASGLEGSPVSESTLTKTIVGLNETVNLVLDFLQDSKDHGQRRGDDLLAAVRIIGSYLAEAPSACKEKTQDLLEYMLSVEGDDESRPFYSICFLLPMLCQITMEIEGCGLMASFAGHKTIVECLMKMIGDNGSMVENYGTIFLACETILNILLKKKELQIHLEESQQSHLLQALSLWTDKSSDPTSIMMAASICALIFDSTSEESLLSLSNFDRRTLESLSQLIAISFSQEDLSYDVGEQLDLHEIITTGYYRWADRFPLVKNAVENALNM